MRVASPREAPIFREAERFDVPVVALPIARKGPVATEEALRFLLDRWEGATESLDSRIVKGMAWFVAAYRAAGGDVQYEVFPGQPHKFTGEPGPALDRALQLSRNFIARQVNAPVPAHA